MGKISPIQLINGAMAVTKALGALHSFAEQADRPPPYMPASTEPDPMTGFAAGDELDKYRYKAGAFFLGQMHPDHGRGFTAGLSDDRHVFMVAGSRSGKDLTISIPNALSWQGPLFSIDPKGDLASFTAMRRATSEAARGTGTSVRHFMGQNVAILDPMGQVRGPARALRVDYNPLSDIDMNKGGGVRAIDAMAASLIKPDEGNGAHFSETAETLVAGLTEAVKMTEPPERQTLPQMRSVLLAGFDTLRGYLGKVETRAGLSQEAVNIMDEVGSDEWGSFRSTLSRNLKWLAEPDMQKHASASAFSLRRAVQAGWSIYVAIPPDQIARFASWLRVIVRTMMEAKMELGSNQQVQQTLCLLDEFPTLGRFKPIEESAGYMAGYGLKLVPVIQNIGQLRNNYAKNWETFLGNAGGIIAFGLNDGETEEYIAGRLGKLIVSETTRSLSSGQSSNFMTPSGMNNSESFNTARHERPVRFPNEIHEQAARETGRAFVLPASGRCFTIARKPYTDLPRGLYDSREFIEQWENNNWKGC